MSSRSLYRVVLLFVGVMMVFTACLATATIVKAADYGDIKRIEKLLSEGTDIDEKDETVNGRTALHMVATKPRFDLVKYLLSKGADVNVKNGDGKTVLEAYMDERKATMLHWYTGIGDLDKAIASIGKGADINARNIDGDTPLHIAVMKSENLGIVIFLVESGADIIATNSLAGMTPLHLAAEEGNFDIVKYILTKDTNVNRRNAHGSTPLISVARWNPFHGFYYDMMKYLVSVGADVNAKDNGGGTVLHLMAMRGSLDIVKYFVSEGVDVNTKNKGGKTAEDIARVDGRTEIADYLKGLK